MSVALSTASPAFQRYQELSRNLQQVRLRCRGLESAEEDRLLAEMERVWYQLSDYEQDLLTREGVVTWD